MNFTFLYTVWTLRKIYNHWHKKGYHCIRNWFRLSFFNAGYRSTLELQYSWVMSSLPVSHIPNTCERMQYPWVISSLSMSHILSTHERMQYPWVISSLRMSHILSSLSKVISLVPVRVCGNRESYPHYLWVISSVSVRVYSTCEDMQYPWGEFH